MVTLYILQQFSYPLDKMKTKQSGPAVIDNTATTWNTKWRLPIQYLDLYFTFGLWRLNGTSCNFGKHVWFVWQYEQRYTLRSIPLKLGHLSSKIYTHDSSKDFC